MEIHGEKASFHFSFIKLLLTATWPVWHFSSDPPPPPSHSLNHMDNGSTNVVGFLLWNSAQNPSIISLNPPHVAMIRYIGVICCDFCDAFNYTLGCSTNNFKTLHPKRTQGDTFNTWKKSVMTVVKQKINVKGKICVINESLGFIIPLIVLPSKQNVSGYFYDWLGELSSNRNTL